MRKTIFFAWVVLLVTSGCGGSTDRNGNVASNSTTQQLATAQPTPAPQPTPAHQSPRETGDVEIIAQHANLRAQANASSDVVIELSRGDQLILLTDGAVGAWYNVKDLASGKSGWIHGNTIKNISTVKAVTPPTTAEKESAKTDSSEKQSKSPAATDGNTSNSGSGTYRNKDGDQVQRPIYSDTVPPGASAKCRDGTYSFSRNRRGTCSRHGGVAEWL